MSDILDAAPRERRRRSDAKRSIGAIISAATTVLGARPDASMEEIATVAGVTRQTVYAHFPTRHALILAIIDALRAEGHAVIEKAGLDALAPPVAIQRFLDIRWQLVHRYPILLELPVARILGSDGHGHQDVVTSYLVDLIRRGQRTGDFDRKLPATWLATATFSLGHAVAEQVAAGRLTASRAVRILEESVFRLYGINPT